MKTIEVYHADSLAGPLGKLKQAFEAAVSGTTINLTSGRSKELAERIASGAVCDVFAPSDPAVVPATGTDWSIIFSANEMVLITQPGNPQQLGKISDLAAPNISLARVVGEKDMATTRSLRFIRQAAEAEGAADLAESIIAATCVQAPTIPDAVAAVTNGSADAAVVYYSAAVAAGNAVAIIRFPATVNLSGEIRNALSIPATAADYETACHFIRFILSGPGQAILQASGQPPLVPPILSGPVPQSFITA